MRVIPTCGRQVVIVVVVVVVVVFTLKYQHGLRSVPTSLCLSPHTRALSAVTIQLFTQNGYTFSRNERMEIKSEPTKKKNKRENTTSQQEKKTGDRRARHVKKIVVHHVYLYMMNEGPS